MPEQKLKPCPFCGGAAQGPTAAWPHTITCTSCGATVSGYGYADFGQAVSIMKWNRREGEDK